MFIGTRGHPHIDEDKRLVHCGLGVGPGAGRDARSIGISDGPDPPNETYLEKVGRLNMARLQAEEIVLRELLLIPPASSSQQPEEEPDGPMAEHLAFEREMWAVLHEEEEPDT